MEKSEKLSSSNFFLFTLSAVSFTAYAGLVGTSWFYGTLRDGHVPTSIGFYLLAFVAFVGMLVGVERWGISRRWMWGGAILFRVMLLLTTPTLSDDVYRMLWDGYVANEGISPYAYAIDSPALDYLENPVRGLANNRWMASPYLPAAQGVFYGITAVFPLRPLFLQTAMVGFDLLAAWVISKLLVLALLPGRRLFLYLWNPLVIVEVAHGAHVDAWMVFLALLAVYFALSPKLLPSPGDDRRVIRRVRIRGLFSPFFLALSTLTKLLPALLLPVLFWFWNWPQRFFYVLAAILILIPFGVQAGWGLGGELEGTGLFGALRIYAAQWNFNSSIFHWLEVWLGKAGVVNPLETAKGIVLGLLVLLLTAVWILARNKKTARSALRWMSLPLMGYVLLTPTFHPWYLLFLLSFLPFLTPAEEEPRWLWLWVAPWLYLSGVLIFSYLTYLDPSDFGELEWVRLLEWVPTIGLGAMAVCVLVFRRREFFETEEN